MADFVLRSLRGGLNNSDPAIAIPDDQCTAAVNVEFNRSMLGERRRGTSAVTLPASLSGKDRVSFLYRHVPSVDHTAAELWAFAFTSGGAWALSRKTTSWTDATTSDMDTVDVSGGISSYQWCAASLHGKLFLAYDSDVDRLHCVDSGSTTPRRVGIAAPAAPTSTDTGSGSFTGTRYYRVRQTVQSAGVTLRRSEPGPELTDTPSGSGTGIVVTRPNSSEDATHWELEASLDNVNFYVLATTAVATSTVTDSQDYATGYAVDYDLSEDVGDYSLIWSPRFLITDEDRLVWGGSWETTIHRYSSTIGWSPVGNADGVGNDERWEADTDPTVDLDRLEGGALTGLSSTVAGEIWAFKFQRIYKLIRSGLRNRAYDTICITKARGALHGSVVAAVDALGRPCLYFIDPAVGPCRAGVGGVQQCGADIRTTWEGINLEATQVVCCGVYYPTNRQVIWNIAIGSNIPSLSIVLQVNETRETNDGVHRGWTTWSGTRAAGLTMCLFSSNIEAGVARNHILVPFIGGEMTGRLHRTDTGDDDAGTAYAASLTTKPFVLKTLASKFGVMMGVLLAKAVTSAKCTMTVIRDFGLETTATITGITFDATASETQVIKVLDDLTGSEMRTAQFTFADTSPAGTRFELNQLTLIESAQQKN